MPYLLILPSMLYMLAFIGYPLVQSLSWALLPDSHGSIPIVRILTSERFSEVLVNTFLLLLAIVPAQFALALLASLVLVQRFPGREVSLYFFTVPLALSDVSAALIWYTMLSSRGFLNKLLMEAGLISSPIQFFGYAFRNMEFLAIVLTEVWRATAIVFINIYAGFQTINRELLEAADVFGLSSLQKLRYVTLPLLKPSIQSALIIRTLFALQTFAPVLILAGFDIPVLATEAFYQYTLVMDVPTAAAWSLLIGAVTFALGAFYLRALRTPEVG
ncbi:carbohydrate ABC transporter permease [Thermofilum pendens]